MTACGETATRHEEQGGGPRQWAAQRGIATWLRRLLARWRLRSPTLKAAADNDNTVHANADTRPPTVYDIGAGIGLLAVMAAKAGAGHVVAVEHSKPVAALLASVVEQNGVKPIVSIVEGDAFDLPEHGLFTFKPELFAAHPDDPDPSSSSGFNQPPIIIVHELFAPHMLCEFCHGVVPAMR